MKITASDVNKLRKTTVAGMMDCKNALVEAQGDFDKAVENLRKKGQKIAANRAERESSEGVVIAKVNSEKTIGVIVFSLKSVEKPLVLLHFRSKMLKHHWFYCVFPHKG